MMSGGGSAFSQGGGRGEMERAGKGRRKSPAPAAAGGGAGEVAPQEAHGDGPESKRERVDQGEAGDERKERGEELPGEIMCDHACASQR